MISVMVLSVYYENDVQMQPLKMMLYTRKEDLFRRLWK